MTDSAGGIIGKYRSEGLSFFPIPYKTKASAIEWKEYQTRRPTDQEVGRWFNGNLTNIAVVCGKISGNLVVADFDSMDTFLSWVNIFHKRTGFHEIMEYTRISQTGRGVHVWLRTKEPVKSQKFPQVDIKGEASYIIAPPSVHPSGAEYKFLNDCPIRTIDSLSDIGIDVNQKPEAPRNEPGWVSQLLQGVGEGQRNDSAIKLAGYFRNTLPQDVTERLLLDWNKKNRPPLADGDILRTVASGYRLTQHPPIVTTVVGGYRLTEPPPNGISSISLNYIERKTTPENEDRACTRQSTRQSHDNSQDSLREKGDLAIPFDKFLKENPEEHWKRDVAEYLGTTYKDGSFQTLVRRRADDNQIRITHGGDKIQWVNKDWKLSRVPRNAREGAFLGLALPFGLERFIKVPQHSQIVVAGEVGSGKTHWAYLLASINAGKIPIRYFFNEMGDAKADRNLDDFPELDAIRENGYELINLDRGNLDIAESLDPDGLNIFDWMHLPATKEWYLALGRELARYSKKVDHGAIVVMLQKKPGEILGYGGELTRMQSEIYLTLNIEENVEGDFAHYGHKVCRIDVVKCKDFKTNINPEVLSFRYRTAPLWGKLEPHNCKEWARMDRKAKNG